MSSFDLQVALLQQRVWHHIIYAGLAYHMCRSVHPFARKEDALHGVQIHYVVTVNNSSRSWRMIARSCDFAEIYKDSDKDLQDPQLLDSCACA